MTVGSGGEGGGREGEGGEGGGVMCEVVETHPSLANKREKVLTLEECLRVFSQR